MGTQTAVQQRGGDTGQQELRDYESRTDGPTKSEERHRLRYERT